MNNYQVRGEISEELRKEFQEYSELTAKLLSHRDITTAKEADMFLNPRFEESLHDPFLLLNMDKAVERLLKAIKAEEKIVIYSDYDCDGIPGGVVLHDFFKKIGYENFSNYIPHRHEEGYGLNISAIEKFGEAGVDVMITVDCGITDVAPVDRANELGIDIIITDHHLQEGELPNAYAVINPNQKADTTYPFKGICGAAVAFKLVQGLIQKGDFDLVKGWEKWLLDMAGMATVADMMPLRDESRALAYYGLQVLRKSRRPGLLQLLRKINVNQRHITEDDIGFMIGPRINAASRMDHPMDAFKLLSTDDVVEGGELSKYLDKLNKERKGVAAATTREVNKRIKELEEIPEVIVMGNPDWRPALLGLVCNSVVEEYKRPVFLWGREGGDTYKGSCRSDGSVNLVTLMGVTPEVFINAGGHAFAGGFSIENDHIHTISETLNTSYKNLPKDTINEVIHIDKKMHIDEVTWENYREIERFAPFGEANPKPVFLFENIVVDVVEHFGKEKNHLRLLFQNSSGDKTSAIGFFKTIENYEKEIIESKPINLVANFEKSVFLGKTELRLRIVDIY